MAANTASAARNFVRVSADGQEVASYSTKGSANRAANKAADGSSVMTAEAFDAFAAAEVAAAESAAKAAREAEAQAIEQAAAEVAVVAEATEVVEKAAKRDRLAPASKKLGRDQKRAVAAWYRKVVEDALAAALEEETDEDNEGDVYLPAATGASAADITAQVEQWLSYLPKVEAAEEV